MSLTTATTATSQTYSQPYSQSDQNSQGQEFTASPADKGAFFGNTPVVQPNVGPANLLAASVYDTGTLTKYQMTNVTTSITTSTTAEISTTVCTGLLTTDVVAVNKPSATAGIGVSGYRVSAANTVAFSYSNISTGTVTTSAEVYDVIGLSQNLTVTTALVPAAVAATTTAEQLFTVTGATLGSLAVVNKPTNQAGLGIGNVRVSAENQVAITFLNNSSGAITPTASETYSFAFVPTLAANSNVLVYKFNQASTAVAASSTQDVTTAVTGLATTDVIMGVSKPSTQAGLGVTGYRVSSAGNLDVQLMNVSSAATSTGETYSASVMRPLARAPFVVSTVSLAPVSVAATTTAEQTFGVAFLTQASTTVLVNKPSLTPGIAIVNARVSAATTLALTYQNSNTTAVIPPTETYTIGYVNLQGPGAVATTGTSQAIIVGVSPIQSAVKDLRAALISLGLTAST
jgi:hypothetical protein